MATASVGDDMKSIGECSRKVVEDMRIVSETVQQYECGAPAPQSRHSSRMPLTAMKRSRCGEESVHGAGAANDAIDAEASAAANANAPRLPRDTARRSTVA